MNTYIKEENARQIDAHIKNSFNSDIRENKLFALLKLVNLKGSKIDAPDNESLNNTKVLEYKKNHYIGFLKTTYKNGSFKLTTVALKNHF
tara:strand:- start:12 stop:281 length:270 start_codon:yes stop_codon:yes gene_type:complete